MAGTDATREAVLGGGPAIILVEPQLGENIGMVARAMLNCGLTDLRLVAPRDGWPNEKAQSASAGADIVIDNARVYETTGDAIADLHRVYATTARARSVVKKVVTPRALAGELLGAEASSENCGVLFGRERTGLTIEDERLAHVLVTVPLNPSYMSLNLAQAVLLIGYEWYLRREAAPEQTLPMGDTRPATAEEYAGFFGQLDHELDEAGFYRNADQRPSMQRNLHALFHRAALTEQEIRTLRGMVARLVGMRKAKASRST